MADITRNYTMTDGNILSPVNVNADIYTPAAPGVGLVSEPNGNLDANNFHAAFVVQRQHIIPGEVVRFAQGGSRFSLDYVDKAFSLDTDTEYVPIAGVAARLYLPYPCDACLLEWQFFYSVWKHSSNLRGDPVPWPPPAAPAIKTKAYFDGSPLAHTEAGTPYTVYANEVPGPEIGIDKIHEHLMSENRFGTDLRTTVAAGWHEVAVHLYMSPQTGGDDVYLTGATPPVATNTTYNHRITFGFRNARLIPFL